MAPNRESLSGKVVLVTGAAQGVGRATARALTRAGAVVALADIDGDAVATTAAEIGRGAIGLGLDVTDHKAFAAVLDEVESRLGPLDVLVNNAGIMPVGHYAAEPDATTSRVIAINLEAPLWSSKEMVRRWKASGHHGRVVNVSSGTGWIAAGGAVAYTASKHGVVGFSHALNLELHGTGIGISVVGPAIIRTRLSVGMADIRGLPKITPEKVADAIVDGLQRPRFAIFVPASMGIMALLTSALPYPLRDGLARLTKADRMLLEVDRTARESYERSIAEPAALTVDRDATKGAPDSAKNGAGSASTRTARNS